MSMTQPGTDSPDTRTAQLTHFIKQRLPDWLLTADAATRVAFHKSYSAHLAHQRAVARRLEHFKNPEDFARPQLELALLARFDTALDVDTHFIKIAHVNVHLLGLFKTTAAATHQTLLQAALQNFEASETSAEGFIEGSMLYARLNTDGWRSLRPKPEQFAQVCRKLDLGAQYQQHIKSVFGASTPQQAWQPPVDFIAHETCTFDVLARIAKMKNAINQSDHDLLLGLIAGHSTPSLQGTPVTLCRINFLDTELTGPVLICADTTDKTLRQPCIGYMPGDPECAVKAYVSIAQFETRLSELLREHQDTFLLHYVPLRHRSTFKQALASYYPNSTSLTLSPFSEPLFEHLHQTRLARMLDDARLLAVPVEDVNIRVRNRRIQALESAGWTLAGLALSLIPGVGEVMLAMTAAYMLKQVYHGVEAWADNHLSEASEYLLDVADNVAEMAIIGAAAGTVATRLRKIQMPDFVANLTPIELANGARRLWNVDLEPYQQPFELPITSAPNKQGMYALNGHRYLKLDQHVFEVSRSYRNGAWRVKHPTDKTAFSPPLVTNEYGAWRLEQERPLIWNNARLIERLGRYGENLEADSVDFVMAATGVSTEMLQRVHSDSLVPPGLLIDALKRVSLDRQISTFIERVDLDQPLGADNAELSLQLLGSLPGWPADQSVQWLDDHGQVIRNFAVTSQTLTQIPITTAQLQAGTALDSALEYLNQDQLATLLGHPPSISPTTNSSALAHTMSEYAQTFREQVFEALYQHSEISDDALTQALRRSYPTVPTGVADQLIASTSPAEQLHLLSARQLPLTLKSEADALMARMSTERVYEGLYLDSVTSERSDLLAFSTLEHLTDWPAALNIEIHQNTADGPTFASTAAQGRPGKRIVIKHANTYQALDLDGNVLGQPGSIYSALYNSLSELERKTLDLSSLTPVRELKQRIAQTRLQADRQWPVRRHVSSEVVEPDEAAFPSNQTLDVNFASQESLAGLTPGTDGIYQGIYQKISENSGRARNYIKVHAWTFQVEHSSLGWRLLDARNPFRSYKPVVRRTADGNWELDPDIGLKGGTPGAWTSKSIVDDSTDDPFLTAGEHPWVEYTPRESAIMRSNENYQHARNQPGTYERADNGRYPLRDLLGNPLRIRAIQTKAKSTTSSTRFNSALIRPYIQWEGYEAVASLYEEKLQLRAFTEADIQIEGEQLLIGQSMVTAKVQLNKGDVLGMYAGELIPYRIALNRKDPYVIDVMLNKPSTTNPRTMPVALSGTNILSRINTTFEYAHGKPARQAPSGYNVEAVPFVVDTVNTEGVKGQYLLTAMFAGETIEPGTELRWNYGYNEQDIQHLFA